MVSCSRPDFQLSGTPASAGDTEIGLQRGEFATLSGLRERGGRLPHRPADDTGPEFQKVSSRDVTHHILLMVLQHCRYRAYWAWEDFKSSVQRWSPASGWQEIRPWKHRRLNIEIQILGDVMGQHGACFGPHVIGAAGPKLARIELQQNRRFPACRSARGAMGEFQLGLHRHQTGSAIVQIDAEVIPRRPVRSH